MPGPAPHLPIAELKAKVILVGAAGVGKTSLIRRYVRNEFDDRYGMTLGAMVYKRVVAVGVNGHRLTVTMTIWDTMGDTALSATLRDVYLHGAQGVLAVADVTDARTVSPLRPWFDAIGEVVGDVPVEILLNKADLGPRDEARDAGLQAGIARAAPCYLTSAKAGDNVAAAFDDLARRIVEGTLVPADQAFDDWDRAILVDCTAAARTPAEVAALREMPLVYAEAHLERLRRRGLLRLASLTMDAHGLPRPAYARTALSESLLASSRN